MKKRLNQNSIKSMGALIDNFDITPRQDGQSIPMPLFFNCVYFGSTVDINVQGETVKKLNDFANNQFTGVLRRGISCAGIASEELHNMIVFENEISYKKPVYLRLPVFVS